MMINTNTNKYIQLFLLVTIFLLALPYNVFNNIGHGLDPSWQIALNWAIDKNMMFGRDIVFTYGPLGPLFTKLDIGFPKFLIVIFELSIAGLITYISFHIGRKNKSVQIPILLFSIILLLHLKNHHSTHLLFPLFLFFTFFHLYENKSIYLHIAIIITSISFFLKINYGIVNIFILFLVFIYKIFISKNKIKSITPFLLTLSITFTLIYTCFNIDIYNYIKSSLHLINAYNDAMMIPISILNTKTLFAITILSIWSIIIISQIPKRIKDPQFLITHFCLSLYLFLLFKNGFVRADDHIYDFFKFSILVFVITLSFIDKYYNKLIILPTAFVGIIISLFSSNSNIYAELNLEKIKSILSINYFSEIIDNNSSKRNISNTDYSLPIELKSHIKNSSVDIIPWDISYLYEYNLNYKPRPVIQSYSAYNYYLDSLNKESLTNINAPEYIIFYPKSIDNRLMSWEESLTKQALINNYEIDSIWHNQFDCTFDSVYYLNSNIDLQNIKSINPNFSIKDHYNDYGQNEGRKACAKELNYIVLKKKNKQILTLYNTEEKSTKINQEIEVNESDMLQIASFNINYNVYGKIKRLFFQPPILNIEITLQNNQTIYRRVIPTMSYSSIINFKLENTYDFKNLFSKKWINNQKIKKMKFVCDKGFESDIKYTIKYYK